MYTIYHLKSAQEVNTDLLESIKAAYKSRPITIIVEEDVNDYELDQEQKEIIDNRFLESEESYISAEVSLKALKKKYGL
jgi:hypothetical protein